MLYGALAVAGYLAWGQICRKHPFGLYKPLQNHMVYGEDATIPWWCQTEEHCTHAFHIPSDGWHVSGSMNVWLRFLFLKKLLQSTQWELCRLRLECRVLTGSLSCRNILCKVLVNIEYFGEVEKYMENCFRKDKAQVTWDGSEKEWKVVRKHGVSDLEGWLRYVQNQRS